jgi:hypothetical protein
MWCDRFQCTPDVGGSGGGSGGGLTEDGRKQLIRAVSAARNAWAHNQRTEFTDSDTISHLSLFVCALLQQEPNLTLLPVAQEELRRVIEIRDRDFSVVQVQHDELVHVQMLQALEKRREQEHKEHKEQLQQMREQMQKRVAVEKARRLKEKAGKKGEREKRKQGVAG